MVALLGSTTCQVSRFFQSCETIETMLRNVVGVVVPVRFRRVVQAC